MAPVPLWSNPEASQRALLFWFILEGRGVTASVGYFLGGQPVTAVLLAFIMVAGAPRSRP